MTPTTQRYIRVQPQRGSPKGRIVAMEGFIAWMDQVRMKELSKHDRAN